MKPSQAMSALVLVGAFFVVLSFLWQRVVGGRNAWSDEQAKQHAELSAKGHRLMHEQAEGPAGHHKTGAAKPEKEQEAARKATEAARKDVQRQFAEKDAELQQARSRGATTALVLRWLGAICAVVGGAGYLVMRNTER